MMVRALVAVTAAFLLGVQVARMAVVNALAQRTPSRAALVWSGHPAIELPVAMTGIAHMVREGRPLTSSVVRSVSDAARKEPLAAEPFLVLGAEAQLSGDGPHAQRLFEAAQWRDPRSLPAAYFLADRYFRIGDLDRCLQEIAALARLASPAPEVATSYLVAYAHNPKTWPKLRDLFRVNPRLGDMALTHLASTIETVPAALALADQDEPWLQAPWFATLIETLTGAGQYRRARSLWVNAIGGRYSGQLLYDSSLSDRTAPPPFNWSLTSSTVGRAERKPGGRLHVVFYGQEDGFLASQLMLLPAGTYVLTSKLQGKPAQAHALSWSVWCDKSAGPLVSSTIDAVAAHGLHFVVPANCPSQWLRLGGASFDRRQQADVTIYSLKLEKVALRA